MGEAIHCSIGIRTPESWGTDEGKPPWFVQLFYDDLYESPDIQASWSYPGEPSKFIGWDLSGALNYGSNSEQAASAMGIMRELGVPFIFVEEGHPEWSGSLEIFTGFESIGRTITENSSTVLDKNDWLRLRNAMTMADGAGEWVDARRLIAAIDAWWAEAEISLNDLTVDHLPVFCPPDPEGRLEITSADMVVGVLNGLPPYTVASGISSMPPTSPEVHALAVEIERTALYGRPAL